MRDVRYRRVRLKDAGMSMACGCATFMECGGISKWMDALLNVGLSPLVPKNIEK